MHQQLKQLTEERIETVTFSSVNTERFSSFLVQSGLSIKPISFEGRLPRETLAAYRWSDHAGKFSEQREQVINYLNTYLKPLLPKCVMIYDVCNRKDFLNMVDNPLLPFNVRGGTDLILALKDAVKGKIPKAGIRAVIELKKEVKDHHVAQVVLQMISADFLTDDGIKVFGVLTDLNKIWNIYWIEGKRILTVTLSNRKKAFEIISKMSADYNGDSVEVRVSGLPKIQRTKIKQFLNIDYNDDIAPMNDAYDQMDENEVQRHQLCSIFALLKYNPLFSNMYANSVINKHLIQHNE